MKKKLFSLILSVITIIAFLPTSINCFASSTTDTANSIISSYVYSEDAANIIITSCPNDTVYSSDISISGYADEDGTLVITQDDEILYCSSKSANEAFTQAFTLSNGRNDIEIYFTNSNGDTARKSFNIIYLSNYDIVVDSSFTGTDGTLVSGIETYSTIQAAIDSIPSTNESEKVILIKTGTYNEKISISTPYISLIGEDMDSTIITYADASDTPTSDGTSTVGTYGSATVTINYEASNFTSENITFENSFDESTTTYTNKQAVAVEDLADESIFTNCTFIGNQDTLLCDAPSSTVDSSTTTSDVYKTRQYFYKCTVEGDVDFIFGRAQAVFNDCDIISLDRGYTSNNGYITAASTWYMFTYGYLFTNCRLLSEESTASGSVHLGRPWHPGKNVYAIARVAYINCYMGSHISSKGWTDMSGFSASDAGFYEYGSYGNGAITSSTRTVLTDEEAINYTMENVFSEDYDTAWNPTDYMSEMYI